MREEEELFEAARKLTDGVERRRFLDVACAEKPELRRLVEELLAASSEADGVFEKPPGAPTELDSLRRTRLRQALGFGNGLCEAKGTPSSGELVGSRIGPYRVLQNIGEGGCGVVFMAEQEQPVRRRVAVKLLKLGMDTRQIIARFEAEGQALALMDHPNIARIFDAGATESGRPYLVMELVRGVKITDYCDQHRLSPNERLRLFIQVCQAVQHAHQKGIIHRDLKPSNILVTVNDGVPTPKVIDFGISKAIEQKLTDKTCFTEFRALIGTPTYMSPEQADLSSVDIDTRTDIYSLGVLLYELLTGRTPFDAKQLMSQGVDAMRRTIREKEPVRPSTKLATLKGEELTTAAKRRSVEGSRLARLLRGDLDWIVMKCLEKDRTRRYETANGLAMDLKRHLNNEPVLARPPSKLYEFQKTLRRHRVGFAAVGAVILALAAGIVMSTWQAVRASRAEQAQSRLRQAAERSRRAADAATLAAEQAGAAEAALRRHAEAEREKARRQAYAADMNLVLQQVNLSNIGEALRLLNRYRPVPAQEDLRGWEWRYLWQFCRSDARFVLGRVPDAFHLSISADGHWLAVTEHDGASFWDLINRRRAAPPWGDHDVIAAEFSRTEPLLALGVRNKPRRSSPIRVVRVDLLRLSGGLRLRDLGTMPDVDALRFSADGKSLAALGPGIIRTWDVQQAKAISQARFPWVGPFERDVGSPWAISPDLKSVVVNDDRVRGDMDPRRVIVLDARTGKPRWSHVGAEENVTAACFSPDSSLLVTGAGYAEGTIRLWDARTGELRGRLEGHRGWTSEFAFLDGGRTLVSVSADQTIRFWNVKTHQPEGVLNGQLAEVVRVAALPGSKGVVTAGGDGRLMVWGRPGKAVRRPYIRIPIAQDLPPNWSFTPDGQGVIAFDTEGYLSRWSGPNFERHDRLVEQPRTGIISPRGDRAWLPNGNDSVTFWDLTSAPARSWTLLLRPGATPLGFGGSPDGMLMVAPINPAAGWDTNSFWVVFTNGTENRVLGFSDDQKRQKGKLGFEIQEWNDITGAIRRRWPIPATNGVLGVEGGRWVTLMCPVPFDGSIRFLDLKTGKVSAWHSPEPQMVYDTTISPDGALVAFTTEPHVARFYRLPRFTLDFSLSGQQLGEKSVAFSPDMRRVATASGGKETLKLFDLGSRQCLLTLEGSGSGDMTTRFSPDGNLLATANDLGLQIWRAPSWDEIAAAERQDHAATPLAAGNPARSPRTAAYARQDGESLPEDPRDEAINAWQTAVRLAPNKSPYSHLMWAKTLVDRGRLMEALPVLHAAMKFYPTGDLNNELRQLLSVALLVNGAGQKGSLLAVLQRTVKANP